MLLGKTLTSLFMYIDPGTGSMLFTVLISVIGAAVYFLRTFFMKLVTRISGGRIKADAKRVPFAIFSDNKRYWNIFEPVIKALKKRGKDVVYYTASEDDPAFDCGLDNVKAVFIGAGNKGFAKLNALNATVVISTTPGLDVYQWKRSPDVKYYVHVLHAAGEVIMYRMFGLDYYDAVLLSGAYQEKDIRDLEALRKLPNKELVTVGLAYMDEMAARLQKEGPGPEHEPTVLLAPSWGKSAIFSVYGGRIIDALLKSDYHIIVRPHPQSFTSEKDMIEDLMARYPESDKLEWNRDRDNFDVLRRSDILISDFSGVTFDFSLVYDKPVLYTDPNFDLSPYDAWWLKRSIWTEGALKRIGMCLTEDKLDNIGEVIQKCLSDPRFAQGREEVRKETWAFPGEAAERTADYLVKKYDEIIAGEAEKNKDDDPGKKKRRKASAVRSEGKGRK